jgi:hypothetical protein
VSVEPAEIELHLALVPRRMRLKTPRGCPPSRSRLGLCAHLQW